MQATFIFNDASALTIDHVKELKDCGRDYQVRYNVPERDGITRIRYISKVGTRYADGNVITPALVRIMQTNIPGELDKLIEVNGGERVI